jgi:serine/threonine protein kinase
MREKIILEHDECIFFAGQVVLMLKYLHDLNMIYRDLKPENLLIEMDGYLKLCDFGFCKICVTGKT